MWPVAHGNWNPPVMSSPVSLKYEISACHSQRSHSRSQSGQWFRTIVLALGPMATKSPNQQQILESWKSMSCLLASGNADEALQTILTFRVDGLFSFHNRDVDTVSSTFQRTEQSGHPSANNNSADTGPVGIVCHTVCRCPQSKRAKPL